MFTDLVVCNGHHWEPKFQNKGDFDGVFIHSQSYKKADPLKTKEY